MTSLGGSRRFTYGTRVWAQHGGRWWPAIVVRARSEGGYRVQYDDGESHEDLPVARVASWDVAPPGPRGSASPHAMAAIVASLVLFGGIVGFAIARDGLMPQALDDRPAIVRVATARR